MQQNTGKQEQQTQNVTASQQNTQQQQQQQQQQQITPQTLQQFTKVCKDATELMLSYKQQSENLKTQISSMVTMYNKTADPSQAVPVQKIIQITNCYESQMKTVHKQYQNLEQQLRKQEKQRNNMISQIQGCFQKLEKMEKLIQLKKDKKLLQNQKQQIQTNQQIKTEKTGNSI